METVVVDGSRTIDATLPPITNFWGPIVAGAIVTAAISSVLLTFGSAIGLSIVSTSLSWRDVSWALLIVSGLFLVFVALASFGFGGYIAGRLRPRYAAIPADLSLRDGIAGLTTWALAVVLAAILAAGLAALSGSVVAASSTARPSASAGEGMLALELDRLFRTDQHVGDADWSYRRAEASRILMTAGSHNGVAPDDRTYLVSVVSGVTRIPEPDAATRTDRAIADARTALVNARKAAILEAFMIGAALLLGAAIAWFAAEEGGRERDADTLPSWNWRLRHPVVRVT
ncbi:MAG TPA: hypothetical protein VJ476_06635 [Rhizomicrobium sp.]|nr:hypothetical protein [Rhizomicrobium sp.]